VAQECPDSGVPSYTTEIVPILQQACIGCHGPDGTAGYYETSYTDVSNQASPMLDQVSGCEMPPQNGPQLSAAQRIALTAWLRCGAPDN
jgi:mono/diheme cytochrome c family protein